MFFNRRKQKRDIVTDCFVEFAPHQWKSYGRVLDLSEGGMRVDLEEVPSMHEEVSLRMDCESGREFNKKAVVIWIIKKVPPEEGAMVGLKFL